jgi:hypothetical protein
MPAVDEAIRVDPFTCVRTDPELLIIDEKYEVVPIVAILDGPIFIVLNDADPETCLNRLVLAETVRSTRVVLGIGCDTIEKSIGADAILCTGVPKINAKLCISRIPKNFEKTESYIVIFSLRDNRIFEV